jgi:hypothetical protein
VKTLYLRKLYGPKKQEGKGVCRTLHNKEFHKLHSSGKITWKVFLNTTRYIPHQEEEEDEEEPAVSEERRCNV